MNVDELQQFFAQSTVTADNEFGTGGTAGHSNEQPPQDEQQEETAQHPRFGRNYKNEGKVAALQRQRRQEHLERQHLAREGWLNRRRAIEEDDTYESFMSRMQRKEVERRKNPYKDMLMFSDWLVDIPGTLSTEWTMLPSPVGRRTLIVANKGETRVYFKNGHLARKFSSFLPGGNAKTAGSLTILDAIVDFQKRKVYLLDLLWWNKLMYTDMEFIARRFFLHSRIDENNAENERNALRGKYKFVLLPSCACSPEEIGQFMLCNAFPFRVDGLLFYYNSAFYIPEQTPLVGWLKPWMLPEILGVPVPELYKEEVVHGSSQEFIDQFNKEHGHISSAEKCRLRAAAAETVSMDEEAEAAECEGRPNATDNWADGQRPAEEAAVAKPAEASESVEE